MLPALRPRAHAGSSAPSRPCPRRKRAHVVSQSSTPHLPGLDGVRALAVAGVLLYHAELPWLLPGGFLGVDVFFALSGFLITALLLREHGLSGRVRLGAFYLRRARRLLPAVLALAGAVALAALLLAPDAIGRLRGDLPAALGYASNWWQIHTGQSYFERLGRPPLLQHLWSLAIEEQFYLAWPAITLLMLRFTARRALALLAFGGALVVTVWMAAMSEAAGYPVLADPSRAYFGTDTHAMGLLAGAALAAVWSPWDGRPGSGLWDLAGLAAVTGLILVLALVRENHPLLYRGGFLGVALVALVLVRAAARPGSVTGWLLSRQPLRWAGERSYSLYLWHWPVFALLRPQQDLPAGPEVAVPLALGITVVLAELSYRALERPIRSGTWAGWSATGQLAFTSGAVASAVAAVLVYLGPAPAAVSSELVSAAGLSATTRMDPASLALAPDSAPAEAADCGAACAADAAGHEGEAPALVLTAVGDSVLLGARPHLERRIAGIVVDAAVGRQGAQGLDRLRQLAAGGLLAPTVLIHLGTNGYLVESQVRAMVAELGGARRILLMNTRGPRRWIPDNNALLRRVAADHRNVTLIDWHGVSDAHPEYFVADGIHLSAAGLRALAGEIRTAGGDALAAALPARVGPDWLQSPVFRYRHLFQAGADPVDQAVPLAQARFPAPAVLASLGWPAADATPEPAVVPGAPQALARPVAHDRFWHRLARCETGGDWQRPGGGLAIAPDQWRRYGGEAFGADAGAAPVASQIAVANRMSTQGWQGPDGIFQAPAGFAVWPCQRVTGTPVLLRHDKDTVLAQAFSLGQTGVLVRDLQLILGLTPTGRYDRATWQAHIRHLIQEGLPEDLAPSGMALADSAPAGAPATTAQP